MPIFFVNRSRMRRLPDDFHLLMTQIAADPGDHPRTDGLRTRQRRPLFDVKFQERCDLREIHQRLTLSHCFRINTAGCHMLTQRRLLFAIKQRRFILREPSRKRQRPNVGLAIETRFLAAHHQNDKITRGRKVGLTHHAGGIQSRHDTCETVVIAALRHAVGMTPRDHRGKRTILTGKTHPDVARCIFRNLKCELPPNRFEVIKGRRFHGPVPLTSYSRTVFTERTNIVKNLGTELLRFFMGTTGHNVSSLQKHSILPIYLFAGTSAYI